MIKSLSDLIYRISLFNADFDQMLNGNNGPVQLSQIMFLRGRNVNSGLAPLDWGQVSNQFLMLSSLLGIQFVSPKHGSSAVANASTSNTSHSFDFRRMTGVKPYPFA